MRRRAGARDDQSYSNPATESIDESLARLARQDRGLSPSGPAAVRGGVIGPRRVARDRFWIVVRWAIILGVAYVVWRIARGT